MNKLIVKKILSTVKTTLIAFLLALFVVTCIIINAVIPSESMEKTIMTGDRLIGNRLAYGINLQIGDKQIITAAKNGKNYNQDNNQKHTDLALSDGFSCVFFHFPSFNLCISVISSVFADVIKLLQFL